MYMTVSDFAFAFVVFALARFLLLLFFLIVLGVIGQLARMDCISSRVAVFCTVLVNPCVYCYLLLLQSHFNR